MNVVIYSKDDCPWCDKAKGLLTQYNFQYKELKYGIDYSKDDLSILMPADKKIAVPQIIIDNILIGGYSDLLSYFEQHNIFGLQT